MRPIVGFRAGTLRRQVAGDAIGDAEQLHRLIDKMRAEIVPEAGANARPFPPPVANDRRYRYGSHPTGIAINLASGYFSWATGFCERQGLHDDLLPDRD